MSGIGEAELQAMLDLLSSAGLTPAEGDQVTVAAGGDSVTFEA